MGRRSLTVILCCTLFAVLPRPAIACDCFPLPLKTPVELDRSSKTLLAVGKVVGLRPVDEQVIAVEIEITEVFLNATPKTRMTVYTQVFGASCYGYDFRLGREYLISTIPSDSIDPTFEILPHVLPKGSYVVGMCMAFDLSFPFGQDRLKTLRTAIYK
jgi:hypothetical protein